MFDWILNTPLAKVVVTQIWNYFPSKLKKLNPTKKQTKKKIIGKSESIISHLR